MTASGCAQARLSLGAYVLGALEPAERALVETHVAICDDCRDELASFAALPGLLGRVSLAEVEAAPRSPGPELLDDMLASLARERQRGRRLRRLGAVAAAVVAIAGGSVAGVALSSSGSSSSASHVTADAVTHSATDPNTRITATVVEWPKAWGAAVEVRLTGLDADAYLSPTEHCRLIAVRADGATDVAASWSAGTTGQVVAQGSTAFPMAQIASFKVMTSSGALLVSVPAHAAAPAATS